MADLKTLEEKLNQPVTRDNWQDIMLSSLIYGVLKYGSESIYPYREVSPANLSPSMIISVEEIVSRAKIRNPREIAPDIETPYFNSYFSVRDIKKMLWITRGLHGSRPPKVMPINGILNSCSIILSQEDESYPKEFFYESIRDNSGKLTKAGFTKRISQLLRLQANLLRLGIIGGRLQEFIRKIIERSADLENDINNLPKVLHLFRTDKYYRDLFAFIASPTKHLDRDQDEFLVDLEEDIETFSFMGKVVDEELKVEDTFSREYYFDIDPKKTFPAAQRVKDRLVSKKMEDRLRKISFWDIMDLHIGTDKRDLEYLLSKMGEGIDIPELSRFIRILKVRGRYPYDFDYVYSQVSELASIDVPEYLAIGKMGDGGTSVVYECLLEKLDIRPRALRIFKINEPTSTSLDGIRRELGDFGIFDHGIRMQELLVSEMGHWLVPVYYWGKLGDGRFYSIEEKIDHTLERESEFDLSRFDEFEDTFMEIAKFLFCLHGTVKSISPGRIKIYRDPRIQTGPGYLHRDIKLANIGKMYGAGIRILDLQSLILKEGEKKQNYFCGSREYSHPEAILYYRYTTDSDFYSFGVCMYKYLTGEFPTDYGNLGGIRESLENLRARLGNLSPKEHNRIIDEACERLDECSIKQRKRPRDFDMWKKIIGSCLRWEGISYDKDYGIYIEFLVKPEYDLTNP